MADNTQLYLVFCLLSLWNVLRILPPALCDDTSIFGFTSIFATDPRMQYSPSLNTSSVWLPVFAEGWEQNASQTSDSGAQVSLSFQGTSVRLLAFAVKNSSFSELNVTVDDQLFMLPGQTIGDEDLYFDLPLGPSKLNPSTYHTVATQKSSVAANDSFWSIVAFIISDQTSSDSEPSSVSSKYHEINLKVLLGAIILALSIGGVVAFLFLHRRRRWYRELARRVVPDPLSASAEQGRLRSSWRSGSSLFSFRRYASSKASAAATLNTTESGKGNSQRGQWPDFPRLSPQIEAKSPHPASGRSVYISRDEPLQDSEALVNQISMLSATAVSMLERNLTLASITPPPSYRTEE